MIDEELSFDEQAKAAVGDTGELPLDINDIEDVRMIVKIQGKHYGIITEKNVEASNELKIGMAMMLLNSGDFKLVIPSLEDLKIRNDKSRIP